MRTIASPPPPAHFTPLPVEAIRDESPASMGATGVAWCGARIPAEINSERRGIQRLSRRSRNRFQAIISATLQNDRAVPYHSPLSHLGTSPLSPAGPINLHSVSSRCLALRDSISFLFSIYYNTGRGTKGGVDFHVPLIETEETSLNEHGSDEQGVMKHFPLAVNNGTLFCSLNCAVYLFKINRVRSE